MHTHQVIHHDLKPGNLFLDADLNIKVGDFGLATLISSPSKEETICRSRSYCSTWQTSTFPDQGRQGSVSVSSLMCSLVLCNLNLPFLGTSSTINMRFCLTRVSRWMRASTFSLLVFKTIHLLGFATCTLIAHYHPISMATTTRQLPLCHLAWQQSWQRMRMMRLLSQQCALP
jgi:serine/threonine protein kinase